jgi:hypothetical protein
MSRSDTPKRERKARRERLRRQAKEWAKIPEEAARGPCENPDCTLPRCIDPWASEYKLYNADYSGTLVLVCYCLRTEDGRTERHLRINGEDMGIVPKGKLFHEDPKKHQAQVEALVDRVMAKFGSGAQIAVAQHFDNGRHLYQGPRDRGKA